MVTTGIAAIAAVHSPKILSDVVSTGPLCDIKSEDMENVNQGVPLDGTPKQRRERASKEK